MAIQIKISAALQRLIDTVARELVGANIFFRLHMDPAYLEEIGNSLQKRHLAILGSSDQRKSSAEAFKLPSAAK